MTAALRSVLALFATIFFMLVCNGLLLTLVTLRAKSEGFGTGALSLIGSAYFVGMLAGPLVAPLLVRRVGHIRTLTGCIGVTILATLTFALSAEPILWVLLRVVVGFAFALTYATIESWLQSRTEDATRGGFMGLYSVIQYAGLAVGSQLVAELDQQGTTLWILAAMAMAAAILPLSLTTQSQPRPPESPRLDLVWFWRISPVGFVCALMIGLINGPHWSLLPIYASDIGLTPALAATFITVLTVGSAALQIPVGRLSDRYDRRKVLVAVCALTAGLEFLLAAFAPALAIPALFASVFLLGGLVATQYYIVAAHANDRAPQERTVVIASSILLLFCAGAIVGPITAGIAMDALGPGGLLVHNGVLHVAMVGFVLYRMMRRAPVRMPADDPPLGYRPPP
jgi:MFS family permease